MYSRDLGFLSLVSIDDTSILLSPTQTLVHVLELFLHNLTLLTLRWSILSRIL